jgi:hypothetical protein
VAALFCMARWGEFLKRTLRKILLSSRCFLALGPTLAHGFCDALAAFGRQFPLLAARRLCCFNGLGRPLRGCRSTWSATARLIAGEQVARMLQAGYLLINAGQYVFYFHVSSLDIA